MTDFRLEAEGRHVDFRASTKDELLEGVQASASMLWNALHPEEIEERVDAAKARLLREYGSVEAVVDAFMRHVPPFDS